MKRIFVLFFLLPNLSFAILTENQYRRQQEREERECRAALKREEQTLRDARAVGRAGLVAAAVSKINDYNRRNGTHETLYTYEDCVAEARAAAANGLVAAYEAKMENCAQMFGR